MSVGPNVKWGALLLIWSVICLLMGGWAGFEFGWGHGFSAQGDDAGKIFHSMSNSINRAQRAERQLRATSNNQPPPSKASVQPDAGR